MPDRPDLAAHQRGFAAVHAVLEHAGRDAATNVLAWRAVLAYAEALADPAADDAGPGPDAVPDYARPDRSDH